jgi:hypothetical protein
VAVRTKTTVGVVVALVMATAAAAHAVVVAPPTVAECAQLQLKSPNFRGSRLAAAVFCLRPSSIQTTASVTWTTCPTTPIEEPCAEGAFSVAFRSTGKGADPDSWGGEDFPGAGLFSLPGTGTYSCKAADIDRQHGRTVIRSYKKSLPLRDQAVGFAAVGKTVKVSTSVHPGQRGPLGVSANVRLGQPNTCQLAALPVSVEAARAVWPGKSVSAASLAGASTRVTSSGSFARAFPVNPSEGLSPGVKIQATVRWRSTIVIVPALKR